MVRWQLAHGATAEKEAEALEKAGRVIPPHLFPPEVRAGYEPWLRAFWDLSSDRQMGNQIGPVPYSSIKSEACNMTPDEAAMFLRCIRAMDEVFLAHASQSADAPKKTLTPDALMGMGKK